MLSIFVCDDQTDHLKQITKVIKNVILFEELDMELKTVSVHPREILSGIDKKGGPGLYFLDIDLKAEINGLDLAVEIRKKDPRAFIVFITTHDEMAPLTFQYKVEALDYIIKENIEEIPRKIRECMLYAMEQYQNPSNAVHKVLAVQIQDRIITLAQEDIIYIEPSVLAHRVLISTTEETVEFFSSIKAIKNQLDERFIQCHKSCVINKDHIQEINLRDRTVKMDNGRVCTVSARQVKNLEGCLDLFAKMQRNVNRS